MNIIGFPLLFSCIIFMIVVDLSFALECYVCDNQEDNKGKCVTTIKTCQQEEDVCLTEVKWGSTPYWTHGAKKQYYISKNCSKLDDCHKQRAQQMRTCTHIWYEDWKCIDCCRGDRCNYYIFSNSGRYGVSRLMLSLIVLLTLHRYF